MYNMHPLSKDEVDRILDNNLVDEFDRLAGTPGFVLSLPTIAMRRGLRT